MPATAYPYQYTGGTFGSNVAQVPFPNPSSDLSSVYPNLSNTNAAASAAILSKLSGQLSPNTVNAIQDAAARFGVANGMPGSNAIPGTLANNNMLYNIGQTIEQEQQQGLEDYARIIPTVSSTQTVSPALQTEINTQNAVSASAPNPSGAQTYAQSLFDRYLNSLNGGKGGGGTGGNIKLGPSLGGSSGAGVPWYSPSAPSSVSGPDGWVMRGGQMVPDSSLTETLYPGGLTNAPGTTMNLNITDPETGLPYSPADWENMGVPDYSTGE